MASTLHFLYHELRPARSRYSYVMPCAEFEDHCALFAQLRDSPAEQRLRPGITFDDGHASDALYALPALERHRLNATFFITSGWTGRRAGFMDWIQLRELRTAGHRIGAHGMHHKLLTGCTPTELDEELRGARLRLEDGLGEEVDSMSLPGGRANGRVLRACHHAGYTQVFTSVPRAENLEAHPGTIGRLNLLAGTSAVWLEAVLRPESGALARLQRTDHVKHLAKSVLGDRLYSSLWSIVNRREPESAETGASSS